MSVSKARLTVYFEEPFWAALYRREEEDGCRVCKVTFGGEPRDQEVSIGHYVEMIHIVGSR